jgi:hypothetical protein
MTSAPARLPAGRTRHDPAAAILLPVFARHHRRRADGDLLAKPRSILAFFNSAGLFILLGAEFLAMILVVVYVGAVAVLFLFVVMMLDVDFAELRQGFLQYLPVGALVGIVSCCWPS